MRAYSSLFFCSASQTSTSCCSLSHTSGEVFRARANLCAISTVTGERSRKISLTVLRATPSRSANSPCVSFISGNTSSRSISPGCVGRLFLLFNINSTPSVIIFKFNVVRVTALEIESQSPVTAHRHAVRAASFALQLMKTIARQIHVVRRLRCV